MSHALILSIGFTGTHRGISDGQRLTLSGLLSRARDIGAKFFRHGDCNGGDKEAHALAADLYYLITIHPPTDPKRRAFCAGHVILPPKPYLVRDRDMVNATEVLIACPYQDYEVLRSGTWATIRYARKKHKPIIRILRSGVIVSENMMQLTDSIQGGLGKWLN